jgi:hypothetical protein
VGDDGPVSEETPRWEQRFRAVRMSLPSWARDAPDRSLYASNVTGTFEVYAWDRGQDSHRQVTDRPNGTWAGTLDPGGEQVWWFADTDGDEFGVWMRQPFAGGANEPAVPGLAPSYPAGLALGRSVVAVGRSTEGGTAVSLRRGSGEPEVVYAHREDAGVAGLSRDETLLAISHSEHGDALKPAVRVFRIDDRSIVADLWDGPGKGLDVAGFSPVYGDPRLLLLHEREGRPLPLLWDPTTGTETHIDADLPGEVGADWYADGSALLLLHDHEGRSELYRHDLGAGALERLDTPPGTVTGATARPDGTVEFAWSSAAQPPALRRLGGGTLLTPPGAPPPPSVPVEDVWADGVGGSMPSSPARPARRRTRRFFSCTAARWRTTPTPSRRTGRRGSTAATPSCRSTTAARPATARCGRTRSTVGPGSPSSRTSRPSGNGWSPTGSPTRRGSCSPAAPGAAT